MLVWRSLMQSAVETVDPGVIGALEAGDAPALLLDERRAACRQKLKKARDGAVVVAHDDQVLAAEFGQEILPGEIDILFRPTNIQPLANHSSSS